MNKTIPPEGLIWLTTFIYVPNVKEAIEYYKSTFGFENTFTLEEGLEDYRFARMRYKNINFALNKEGEFNHISKTPVESKIQCPITFYIYVENVEEFYNKIKNNVKTLEIPTEQFYGEIKCKVEDRYGFIWEFATPIN